MASSSPPPPPDPNRPNPFNTGCSGTPARPALRRSKTLANPESPARWTREPLADVTNAVLARERRLPLGRLQRIPTDLLPIPPFSPSPTTATARRDPAAENTPSSPSPSASRIPRSTALRRTRSAAPTFRSGEPSSPTTGAFARAVTAAGGGAAPRASPSPQPAAAAVAATEAGPSTRALRPRPRQSAGTNAPTSLPGRRTRTVSDSSAASASASSSSFSSSASSASRRRTFGGSPSASIGATLAAVIEDEPIGAAASVRAPGATTTPLTRHRSVSDAEGAAPGEGGPEGERRLRRRRTVGGSAEPVGGSSVSPPQQRRKGLR